MGILENLSDKGKKPDHCDGIVIDGAALVHFLSPKDVNTFEEYFYLQFFPHLRTQADYLSIKRIDVVWDLYFSDSTKEATREGRGDGVRRKDLPSKGKKSL